MDIQSDNGLLYTIKDGIKQCLGYIMDFGPQGCFIPSSKIPISPEQASLHNQILSQSEILGLDSCKIGEKGCFYYDSSNVKITTFIGITVSSVIRLKGKSIKFYYNNKEFSGKLRKDCDLFNFKRTK